MVLMKRFIRMGDEILHQLFAHTFSYFLFLFGGSGVGFVKINAHCTLTEGGVEHSERLKGICFLKGDSVAVLVGLYCEDGTVHSLLVEQPR